MGRLIEIFGSAGSGKTLAIIDIVKKSLKQGHDTLIIADDLRLYVDGLVNNDETINIETLYKCRLLDVYPDGINISKISQVVNEYNQMVDEYNKENNISEKDTSKLIIIDSERFYENINNDFIKRFIELAISLGNCNIIWSRQCNIEGNITGEYHDVVYRVSKKGDDIINIENIAPWNFIADDSIFDFKDKVFKIN